MGKRHGLRFQLALLIQISTIIHFKAPKLFRFAQQDKSFGFCRNHKTPFYVTLSKKTFYSALSL
jgi:hypothetical protein